MKPHYRSLDELFRLLDADHREACERILADHQERFRRAWGSSHNHQAWSGGYLDHVVETMNLALGLYEALNAQRPLPFGAADALLIMFLHDIEKPWKGRRQAGALMRFQNAWLGLWRRLSRVPRLWDLAEDIEFRSKAERREFREYLMKLYDIILTPAQANALRYVEGEGDDYSGKRRVMNELAAFCHLCDVTSARIWFNHPFTNQADSWTGARRHSGE